MPDTAAWVRGVAGVAWDHMDVHVQYCLAGGDAVVDSDIVAVGMELGVQRLPSGGDGAKQCVLLLDGRLAEGGNVTAGDNQRVSW